MTGLICVVTGSKDELLKGIVKAEVVSAGGTVDAATCTFDNIWRLLDMGMFEAIIAAVVHCDDAVVVNALIGSWVWDCIVIAGDRLFVFVCLKTLRSRSSYSSRISAIFIFLSDSTNLTQLTP